MTSADPVADQLAATVTIVVVMVALAARRWWGGGWKTPVHSGFTKRKLNLKPML